MMVDFPDICSKMSWKTPVVNDWNCLPFYTHSRKYQLNDPLIWTSNFDFSLGSPGKCNNDLFNWI